MSAFFSESQTELRGDHTDLGAAVDGKGSGAGVVLQPATEGEEDLLSSCHLAYKTAQLQCQTGAIDFTPDDYTCQNFFFFLL